MIKFKLIFLLISANLVAFSQTHEINCTESPYISFEAKNTRIYKYSPTYVAKKAYLNLKDVKNEYPESLIESEMSVISREWSSFNYGKARDAEPERYSKISKMNIDKNYIQLLYKIQYEVNGTEFAIIKIHIFSEDKKDPTGYALAMKKQQNRWVIYDESAITDLMFLFISLKTESIDAIFNQQKSGNLALDNIITTSKENGIFNLNKCLFALKTTLEKEKTSLESILDPNRMFK